MALPKIPNYDLLACLGGGMLTSVYSARELSSDKPCVVKVLRPDWRDEPTAIKLLQREARACLSVEHPHLVRLHYAHVTKPPYFLVLEMLCGESLRRRLRRDYALELPTAIWIARQTAEAMAAMHRAGFVHGDIKPDNIRVCSDGSAVLLDLGFAHRPGENANFLRQGFIMGTVDYLAPELCCADHPSDTPASDIFSFGVTLFEMITGKLPYPTGSIAQTVRRHQADPPLDIRQLDESLPPAFSQLMARLLARKPKDRPRAPMILQQLIDLEIYAMKLQKSA